MSSWGDEPVSATTHKTVRARKPHRCGACGETIQPGHLYTRESWEFDGTAGTDKRCQRCELIYQHLLCRTEQDRTRWEQGVDPQLACGHDYAEAWDEEPPPAIAALAFALPGEIGEIA